jgi:hypothetical protein
MRRSCDTTSGRRSCHPVVGIIFTFLFYALAIGAIGLAHVIGFSFGWSFVTGLLGAYISFNPLMRLLLRLFRRPSKPDPTLA